MLTKEPFKHPERASLKKYTEEIYRMIAFLIQCQDGRGAYNPLHGATDDNYTTDSIRKDIAQVAKLETELSVHSPLSDVIQTVLHQLLYDMFTGELETDLEVAYFDYIPVQFLIARCTEANGKIKEPSQIAPIMASLLWGLKMVNLTNGLRMKNQYGGKATR